MKKYFLVFCFLLLSFGGYFYFFPIYPNYNIPNEYFHTRFYDKGFDSQENGFQEFKKLIEDLNQHKEILQEFNTYHKCFIGNDCNINLKYSSIEEKEKKLQKILGKTNNIQEFLKISQNFLSEFEQITKKYKYISMLNYKNNENGDFPVGEEFLSILNLFYLSNGLIFYNQYFPQQKEVDGNINLLYKHISWFSNNLDSEDSTYHIIINIFKNFFIYLENNIQNFSAVDKIKILNNIKKYPISNDMVQNGRKARYSYGVIIFKNLFNIGLTAGQGKIKSLLFYDIKDTLNLLKKKEYETIEGNCDFEIKINGKNWIGRTLLQTGDCLTPKFRKQEEVLKKREDIIQLLIK